MKARVRLWTICLGFLLTGVGSALVGASLPSMLREWHLSDRAGGLLLFSLFIGSTIGVLFAGLAPPLMSGIGLGASACAALLLSLASPPTLIFCFLLYGCGLGTTMTSISVLRSREVPITETTLEMNRLNLIWAAGACLAPALALRSLRTVSVHALFAGVTFAFAVGAVVLLIVNQWTRTAAKPGSPSVTPRLERLAPLRMCVFAGAAVGLETAIGSWLTAYSQRMGHGNGVAVTANSAFWLGLLLGRGAHSLRIGQRLNGPGGVALHLGAVTLAMALLVGIPREALLPASALLAGIGLGPLYPLVLSWALPRYRSSAVFMLAGTAASLLPWVTGVISTSFRSLRAGLVAPALTVLVLIAAALTMRREISASPDMAS